MLAASGALPDSVAMLTQLLVPSLVNQLTALPQWLDKGEAHALAHGNDPADLLAVRLAVDMFPLHSQLRVIAFQAQEAIWRLRGEETPADTVALRTRASAGQNDPGSLAEIRAILGQALAFVRAVGPDELDAAADRPLSHALPMGMVFDMTGFTYVRDWSLPQVGFHVDMAYALLRSAGVALGKADYVPHMFGYLRPGTMPGG
ncbi:hypothetical protein GGQ97_000854 [Sphingomonas kaistensis]|uniref:DUF1993 domain-containing protein n=1 Tax=Sphingomonas kaistensis TaxID=298708 RepID=A0A7X6BGH0_9SPHN|nr:hypothetical protein [Sphingomonas kaistensis]